MSIISTIKANPLPFAIGGIAAIGGIWYYESHKSSSPTTETPSAPTGGTGPNSNGTGGGGGGQLASLLTALETDIGALTTAIQGSGPGTTPFGPGPNVAVGTPGPAGPAGPTGATGLTGPAGPAASTSTTTTTITSPSPSASQILAQPTANPSATVGYITGASAMPTSANGTTPTYTGTPLGPGTPVISTAGAAAPTTTPQTPINVGHYVPIPTPSAPAAFTNPSNPEGAGANAAGTAQANPKVPHTQNQPGANPSGAGVHY
jgi:collagen type I alpha